MVRQKALVGSLKKFSVKEQRIFALSSSNSTECLFFQPFKSSNSSCEDVNGLPVTQNFNKDQGQTYCQWKVMLDFHKLHSLKKRRQFKRRKMYILPMGSSHHEILLNNALQNSDKKLFDILFKFTSIFFCGMDVKILEFQNMDSLGFTTRIHSQTNEEQVLVDDVLDYLKKVKPKDSFCIVAWSWLDLFPNPELNFVLGQASFETGCAVISCGHYSALKQTSSNKVPLLHHNISTKHCFLIHQFSESTTSQDCCSDVDNGVVWRVIKVLTHEVCHLMGMHHCTFFCCLMNESNNVNEAENQPFFLCPICLRKLQKFLQFPLESRYRSIKNYIEHFCEAYSTGKCCDLPQYVSSETLQKQSPKPNDISDSFTVNKYKDCVTWLENVLLYMNS